jgi:hypothetical protein
MLGSHRERCAVLAFVASLVFAASCDNRPSDVSEAPNVFTEHRFQAVKGDRKPFGGDCRLGGRAQCQGPQSVCLHFGGAPPDRGWACSRPCNVDADCVSGAVAMTCRSVFPSPDGKYCVPPYDFVPSP